MKRVLVAYDGTPGAEAALLNLKCAGLPDRGEAKIISFADVWLPPNWDESESGFPDRVAGARVAARKHADEALEAATKAAQRGLAQMRELFPHWLLRAQAKADSPAWGIVAEARQWPADLIVVGSHGRSVFQKFFLGSVSYKVAAEANCSVRIFKPAQRADDGVLRLILAVDGSDDSKAAVGEVLEREWPSRTEFHLVSVIDRKAATASLWDEDSAITEDWIPSMLAEQAESFQARQFNTCTHILEGDVKATLLESAEKWNADCLFLGARGIDHRDRLYLGTSASAIAARAHCTVEIVRTRTVPKKGAPVPSVSTGLLQPV